MPTGYFISIQDTQEYSSILYLLCCYITCLETGSDLFYCQLSLTLTALTSVAHWTLKPSLSLFSLVSSTLSHFSLVFLARFRSLPLTTTSSHRKQSSISVHPKTQPNPPQPSPASCAPLNTVTLSAKPPAFDIIPLNPWTSFNTILAPSQSIFTRSTNQ